jgi:hypothetical protein
MPYERKTEDILISEDLRRILKEIETESVVASLLLKKRHSKDDLCDSHVNYISISTEDSKKISYLTIDRIDSLDEKDYWTSSRRYQAKPGSFISKIFKNVSSKEVEKFSSLFRSLSSKAEFEFNVVCGESIAKYYNIDTYASERGSLGASCMKYNSCQDYFDIYVDNSDVISMLVMFDNKGRLIGRALLWKFDDKKIMDRIYTINDEDLSFHFKKWATDNDYLYKSEQNWYNLLLFENLKTSRSEVQLEIKLERTGYSNYPYLDTFKFIDLNIGTLYNYLPKESNMSNLKTLSATDGSIYNYDYFCFDSIYRIIRHRHDSQYLDYLDIYTSNNDINYSNINNCYILNRDSLYNVAIGDYIFNEEYNRFNRDKVSMLITQSAKHQIQTRDTISYENEELTPNYIESYFNDRLRMEMSDLLNNTLVGFND